MMISILVNIKKIVGGLAQLARAPALHAGGPGFESLILHKKGRRLLAAFFIFRNNQYWAMFLVYILFSSSLNKYYVGSTQHLDIRLEEHNRGKSPFTKTGIPWTLVQTISCASRTEAVQLENQIKKRGITRYLDDNAVSH